MIAKPAKSKRRRARAPDVISREITVTSFALHVFTRVDTPRGLPASIESGPWLELRGEFDEPLRDVRAARVNAHPEESARVEREPTSIGALIGLRPVADIVVALPPADFDRVWMLTLAGQARFVHVIMTLPKWRSALVKNISFANTSENVDPDEPPTHARLTPEHASDEA